MENEQCVPHGPRYSPLRNKNSVPCIYREEDGVIKDRRQRGRKAYINFQCPGEESNAARKFNWSHSGGRRQLRETFKAFPLELEEASCIRAGLVSSYYIVYTLALYAGRDARKY